MDPVAGRRGRSRRGGRGFGRPGRGGGGAVEGWTSSATGSGRPAPAPDRGFDRGERGRRGGRGSPAAAGRRSQRGGAMVWRPRHQSGSAGGDAVTPAALENEDILGEILLRLSPGPSSLPRAGAVCRRWRRIVADPGFVRRFRARHGRAPLLGFFSHNTGRGKVAFTPVLDPPDRVPAAAGFSLRLPRGSSVCGCRHGRVLVVNGKPLSFLVWDPVSGDQCRVPLPSASSGAGGNKYMIDGTVICADGSQGHVHGACHASPYRVVFLGRCGDEIVTWVYSSETGTWGDAISIMWPSEFDPDDFGCSNTLIGNSVYWLFEERSMTILKFDLDRQCLATIEVPPEVIGIDISVRDDFEFLIMPAEGGGLGFLVLAGFNARIWKRKASCDGGTGWVLGNIIKLDLPLKPWARRCSTEIIGFAEDYNVVFILTCGGVVFIVHPESGQFKKLPQKQGFNICYPFTSFWPAPVSTVPTAMREEDVLTHTDVVKDPELNQLVDDRWDPMILEATMPPVPL